MHPTILTHCDTIFNAHSVKIVHKNVRMKAGIFPGFFVSLLLLFFFECSTVIHHP